MVGAAAAFLGDVDPRSPEASPLYAELSGLPQALFSVGTLDPLLDDTLSHADIGQFLRQARMGV